MIGPTTAMTQDYTTLNNPRFLYAAELNHPFPDWVVQTAVPAREEFEKLASTAFADPKRRLLPLSTKSAVFHSAINLFAQMHEYDDETFERVKEACAFYGIEEDVAPYANIFAEEHEKSASLAEVPDGRYAINTTLNGQEFKLLPLNDAADVTSSAFDLSKMASENRICFSMLVPAAVEIVKAAADYGVSNLPLLVERFGIERYADAEVAAQRIAGREQFCKDASVRDLLARDYREALAAIESDPYGAMEKIATIDHAAGLVPNLRVSSLIPTPFDIVFSGPAFAEATKAAQENILVRDVLVPLKEARRINPVAADYHLSKSAAEDFAKIKDTPDARDLSLAMENWSEKDQRTFLRLAVDAAA